MAAPSPMVIQVQVTAQQRSGNSQKGNPYIMVEAYASLPGIPYPQRFMFYCGAQNEVPQPGFYECDVQVSVKNDRLDFQVDPRQARRMQEPQAAKSA